MCRKGVSLVSCVDFANGDPELILEYPASNPAILFIAIQKFNRSLVYPSGEFWVSLCSQAGVVVVFGECHNTLLILYVSFPKTLGSGNISALLGGFVASGQYHHCVTALPTEVQPNARSFSHQATLKNAAHTQ